MGFLIDVGAGSGGLASAICRRIRVAGFKYKFRLWSVDLETADPARFFKKKSLRNLVDSLIYLGDDYRGWLNRERPLPAAEGLRITLISKILDIMSHFSITFMPLDKMYSSLPKVLSPSKYEEHLPTHCLAPDGKGVEALSISNSRISLPEGKGFMQISLSEFNNGLFVISSGKPANNTEKGIYPSVRKFDPKCLVTLSGESILSCLADNCDYIIIQDADLTPEDLLNHAEAFHLSSIVISDMTKALKLKGNYAYLIWNKHAVAPSITGEQIW